MTEEREYFGYGLSPEGREAAWEEVETDLPAKGKGCPLTADLMELALGQASAETAERLTKHLEQCAYCQRCFESYRRSAESLVSRKPLPLNDSLLGEFLADPELVGPAEGEQQEEGSPEPEQPPDPVVVPWRGAERPGPENGLAKTPFREYLLTPAERKSLPPEPTKTGTPVSEYALARQASTVIKVVPPNGVNGVATLKVKKKTLIATAAAVIPLFLAMTGAGAQYAVSLKRENDELKRRVDASGLRNPWTVADPKAFRVAGYNQIAIEGEFNTAYAQEVRVRWGTEKDGGFTSLYKGGPEPPAKASTEKFSKPSPELSLNGERITPVLEFVPYPGVRGDFPEFFTKEKTHLTRTFLLSPDGVVADPPATYPLVAELRQIFSSGENRYMVYGKVFGWNKDKIAYLMIEATTAGKVWVGAKLAVGPDGTFMSRCFLAESVDQQHYGLYVIVTDRNDAPALVDRGQFEFGVNWASKGFIRSQTWIKENNGKEGFTKF